MRAGQMKACRFCSSTPRRGSGRARAAGRDSTTTATGLTTATEGSERWLPSALPRNAADDIHIANKG
jgi:hypothetical protein